MNKRNNPIIAASDSGTNTKRLGTIVALELSALKLGKLIAEQTGRTVTVLDDNEVPLETFEGRPEH